MNKKTSSSETITFLGTGGGRFMIISQTLATGGLWLNLGGTEILLDPGPGCVVRTANKKLKPENLSAIILSHRHLDHSADINVMIEAMTRGGHNQHGNLFAPSDAFDKEPVIYSYLKNYVDGVEILYEGGSYNVADVSFTTPVRHIHGPETYGIVFRTEKHSFSYIADTRYFEDIKKHYKNDLLIINVVFLEPRPPTDNPLAPTDHLSMPDAERIINEIKPKIAILTHFGGNVYRADPQKIAEEMSEKTGVRVIAAKDGMKFDLAEID
ncbi:MBL fold metallo-hydrolase [Chloroflexota bacterium]